VLSVIHGQFCGSSYALIRLKTELPGNFHWIFPYKILKNPTDLGGHTRSQTGMRSVYGAPCFSECLEHMNDQCLAIFFVPYYKHLKCVKSVHVLGEL
jgi:hypothetical protein